jgi:hypothetical protein
MHPAEGGRIFIFFKLFVVQSEELYLTDKYLSLIIIRPTTIMEVVLTERIYIRSIT